MLHVKNMTKNSEASRTWHKLQISIFNKHEISPTKNFFYNAEEQQA